MRRHRNIKIGHFGPASSDYDTRALFEAGADVFRLNMSRGSHADHKARYDAIRKVEVDLGRPIAVLADLQGPVETARGHIFRHRPARTGRRREVPL